MCLVKLARTQSRRETITAPFKVLTNTEIHWETGRGREAERDKEREGERGGEGEGERERLQ